MPVLIALVLAIILLAVAAVLVWLIIQTLREQAVMRRSLDLVMLQVTLPKDLTKEDREEGIGQDIRERIAVAEQWLSTLANLPTKRLDRRLYGRPILVLEIVAREDGVIVFYAGAERRFIDHLEKQIYAFYPEAQVNAASDFTIFEPADIIRTGLLKLTRKSHLPIATYQELEVDPMQSLTGALAKIQNRDAAVIQLVCRPASTKTRQRGKKVARQTIQGKQADVSADKSALAKAGSSLTQTPEQRQQKEAKNAQLTPGAQQKIELVEHKLSQQQFDVNIRIAVSTRVPEETDRITNAIVGAFTQYDLPNLNSLHFTATNKSSRFIRDLIFRIPRSRQASTFSTTELASLFHFPLPTTATPNILWRGAKIAPAPAEIPTQGILLGHNIYRGESRKIFLSADDRRRHLYLIGQTGTGKTTMFLNMIVQDMHAGHGVAVVDPHGDLIEDVLLHIPAQRIADVILFDPRDHARPLGFNILETKDPAQKDLIVNEVVQILQKLAARLNPESIGPMFEHYLRNALLALSEDNQATLLDVPRMFIDEDFRKKILDQNADPTVRQFWDKEFAQSQRGQMSADMLSYVISKLGRFISNATIRNIIGQPTSSFDMREVMDQRKILLCNLSKGSLGDINADLLGFVLVSKIQIAALSRASVDPSNRPDFYLYLDEFQNFTTDSIAIILSEARKYNLNLNLTHQFIDQLEDNIKEAVFGNVGTIISYRVGSEDAEFLKNQFDPVFSAYDLVNLERFTAVARPLVNGTPARPFSLTIPAPPAGGNADIRDLVREQSRQRYGRAKADVEENILERFKYSTENTNDTASSDHDDYLSESLFDVK